MSDLSRFPDRTLLKDFEGGAVYLAREDEDWLVITDESSMFGILDEEDLIGIQPIKLYRFDSEEERDNYVRERVGRHDFPLRTHLDTAKKRIRP